MRRSGTSERAGEPLPKRFTPLFWDYDFERLSWPEDRELIMRRVLAEGDWETIRWLRQRTTDAVLRQWIERRQGRGLDAKRLRLWEVILGLPHPQVTRWLAAPARRVWDRRARR